MTLLSPSSAPLQNLAVLSAVGHGRSRMEASAESWRKPLTKQSLCNKIYSEYTTLITVVPHGGFVDRE
uniref:Uncharacterized protein n=1 Tax=Oryza brachyantha TaxID=4533 RepID=J3N5J5_ORYBR